MGCSDVELGRCKNLIKNQNMLILSKTQWEQLRDRRNYRCWNLEQNIKCWCNTVGKTASVEEMEEVTLWVIMHDSVRRRV